jgi:calreticulin
MKATFVATLVLATLALASATVHFKETFDDDTWEKRWVKSSNKEKEGTQGEWGISSGKHHGDEKAARGLKTTQDARFYQISAEMPEFSNKDKPLILQYSVKHEQNIDCGGGYIKLLPAGLNQPDFSGDSDYNIMFGPDICGSSTRKTHLIFNYKGKNHLIKEDIRTETDEWTHLYTLILNPDNTFEVLIDGKEAKKGSLKTDFDLLPPKEIKDPSAKKPSDWVDEKYIADPTDKKPEGWDDTPKEIPDPDAKKPDDWDDELDGEWEPPVIANPEWKGEWKPKMIDNPAYKGEWVHPVVPNPDYFEDDNLYLYKSTKFVGFELWQVKSGTIFDNILVTDDRAEADKLAEVTKKEQDAEKKAKEKEDEARKAKEEEERKQREAEQGDAAEDEAEDDHHGHDHDHDEL